MGEEELVERLEAVVRREVRKHSYQGYLDTRLQQTFEPSARKRRQANLDQKYQQLNKVCRILNRDVYVGIPQAQ